jgi:linoleoyl-CoA desaturase
LMVVNVTFGQWFVGFLSMHAVIGLLITAVFQLAHVVEGPTHHEPTLSGKMDNTWAIHQLETTADFARKSTVLGWFIGGLNFQVEHHLFPTICHVHYPKISEIVKQTATEFGLPYHDQKTFFSAFRSHLRVLKAFGRGEEIAA